MPISATIQSLCLPSKVYLAISVIWMVLAIAQNIHNERHYTMAHMSCEVPSTAVIMMLKLVYIVFWAWILNLMCKDGHSGIAWFLVLVPYVIFALLIMMVSHYQKKSKPRPHTDARHEY